MIKGKVVLVPFPFDDFSNTKLRPALCLTEFIGIHRHVVIAFISSKIPTELLETDLLLDSTSDDFTKTGLKLSSTLRLHRLITISSSLIQRELGALSPVLQNDVSKRLKKLFDLK